MAEPATVLSLVFVLALIYWVEALKRKRRLYPPGPKPLYLVGNLFDLPTERPWLVYRDWSERYGSDVLFVHLPRQPAIILNTFQAAIDLMEKRSRLYSDRPVEVMDELTGWEYNFVFQQYSQKWRDRRRCFDQYFNQMAVHQYHPVQTREVGAFLNRALSFERQIDVQSVSLIFATIILEVTYGIRINGFDHELASLSQKAVEAFVISKVPGAFWVEFFPWLKYVPAWVPGSSARKVGARYKPVVEASRDRPFDVAAKAVSDGTAVPSVLQMIIQKLQDNFPDTNSAQCKAEVQIAKDTMGVAYSAAIDTQTSASCWFFVAMSIAPEVQRKAQRELDAVVGGGRLPTMDDISSLPYIQAVFREVMRWAPVTPLGVSHRLLTDDEYNGHFMPGGSVIIPNVWAILHNPVDYPDPERFYPDRFMRNGLLDPEVRDPLLAAFGFGRRICPGRYLAKDTLMLLFASVLHVFDIESTSITSADKQTPIPKATTGLISYPESVPCRLKPRNADAVQLVNTILK